MGIYGYADTLPLGKKKPNMLVFYRTEILPRGENAWLEITQRNITCPFIFPLRAEKFRITLSGKNACPFKILYREVLFLPLDEAKLIDETRGYRVYRAVCCCGNLVKTLGWKWSTARVFPFGDYPRRSPSRVVVRYPHHTPLQWAE